MITKILLQNGYANFANLPRTEQGGVTMTDVATVASNMAYFGYQPNKTLTEAMLATSKDALVSFWKDLEKALKLVKKTSVSMDSFVVYKNFPKEVLDMTQEQYWEKQLQIYLGQLPQDEAGDEEKPRAALDERKELFVLQLSNVNTLPELMAKLFDKKSGWTDTDKEHVTVLVSEIRPAELPIDKFGFKENAMLVFCHILGDEDLKAQISIKIADATDVIRLAVAISGGDIQQWGSCKFKSLSRGLRKMLVQMLDESKNLEQDMSLHQEVWKRFFAMLHPSDFKASRVAQAYDKLYKGELKTFNATIEELLAKKLVGAFDYLAYRPGEFLRKFTAVYAAFGHLAAIQFCLIVKNLSVRQLLWFKQYLLTINNRKTMVYPPKGNWAKVQLSPNKRKIEQESIDLIVAKIDKEVRIRLNAKTPAGFVLDPATANIKLPSNGQDLANYGRGTKFPIPENITFIRTASYWQNDRHCWFDNGFNFFDENWANVGYCGWNGTTMPKAAIFSGDPMNSSELKGRACQMIDLYLDKMPENVRFAVWSILAYSNIPFSESGEVLGTMQMGEKAETGKLYEPSRAQLVFPLKSNAKTSYLAVVDLKERTIMYLDMGLRGQVSSVSSNAATLTEQMPAVMEYINAIPSVFDLFKNNQCIDVNLDTDESPVPVLYTDETNPVNAEEAYVLRPKNPDSNNFTQLSLDAYLGL